MSIVRIKIVSRGSGFGAARIVSQPTADARPLSIFAQK